MMNFMNRFLSKNIGNPSSILFYVSFFLISLSRMLQSSGLVEISESAMDVFMVFACILFLLKIVFDKTGAKKLLVKIIIALLVVVLRMFGLPMPIVSSCFAFLAMENVNIKTVIKIDLLVKSAFFIFSAIVFGADYLTGEERVTEYIFEAKKGTAVALYFKNPNTTGLVGTMIALDLLYLKDNKKFRDFIFPTLIAGTTFALTTSRAPFLVYCVYLALQLIKNGKVLTIIQKLTYPILFAFTFYVINSVPVGSSMYKILNPLLSSRIWYSIVAYNSVGLTILPSLANTILLKNYIIDIFYMRCIVRYGLITLLLYYIPHLILPVNATNEQKRMSIIASIYLFFEDAVSNVGFAIPYLIIADAIFNKKEISDGKNKKQD